MSADEKTAFYFRHRDQIEEWAALRQEARSELIEELNALVELFAETAAAVGAELYRDKGPYTKVGLTRPHWQAGDLDMAVVLGWTPKNLLVPGAENPWPYVGILVRGASAGTDAFDRVRESCTRSARELRWSRSERGFPFWVDVPAPTPFSTVSEYARTCAAQALDGWRALDSQLEEIARSGPGAQS
jgi:hypothetical protein